MTLPPTGSWGTFPEKSVVMVPAKLKRGGNFIEIEPSPNDNFAELDRIDFLRIIRDTIPANGFDNGIRVRLTKDDEFAIKDGGYAIFENVVLDSLKDIGNVFLQVKNASDQILQLFRILSSLIRTLTVGTGITPVRHPAGCSWTLPPVWTFTIPRRQYGVKRKSPAISRR